MHISKEHDKNALSCLPHSEHGRNEAECAMVEDVK